MRSDERRNTSTASANPQARYARNMAAITLSAGLRPCRMARCRCFTLTGNRRWHTPPTSSREAPRRAGLSARSHPRVQPSCPHSRRRCAAPRWPQEGARLRRSRPDAAHRSAVRHSPRLTAAEAIRLSERVTFGSRAVAVGSFKNLTDPSDLRQYGRWSYLRLGK